MFRPAIVSTAVLCGLFLAAGAEAKNPNFIPTPKIAIPKPLAANRILVLPRNITVPLQDEAAEESDSNTKKKNVGSSGKSLGKKKKQTSAGSVGNGSALTVGRQTASLPDSSEGLLIPDQLKEILPGLHGDGPELARLRDILEGLEGFGNDGSFDAFGTLFPENETDPKDLLGGNSHTTGQGNDSDHPGHSLDDFAAGFADQGSGDGRKRDGEQSGSVGFGGDRGSDAGWPAVGAFGGGVSDPSGQVSQRNRGGRTPTGRVDTTRRGGRIITTWFNDERGTTTTSQREDRRGNNIGQLEVHTKNRHGSTSTRVEGGGVRVQVYTPSAEAEGRGHGTYTREQWYETGEDGNPERHTVWYDDDGGYEVVHRENPDGTETEIRRGPLPDDSQPAPDDTGSGGPSVWHEAGFYHVLCSARSCTYKPFTMEEIVTRMGVRVNPGGMEQPDGIDTGPRVTPGAATDPHPDDAMYGRSGRQRPIGQGCGGGMIRC